jgi:hypothetical protein
MAKWSIIMLHNDNLNDSTSQDIFILMASKLNLEFVLVRVSAGYLSTLKSY